MWDNCRMFGAASSAAVCTCKLLALPATRRAATGDGAVAGRSKHGACSHIFQEQLPGDATCFPGFMQQWWRPNPLWTFNFCLSPCPVQDMLLAAQCLEQPAQLLCAPAPPEEAIAAASPQGDPSDLDAQLRKSIGTSLSLAVMELSRG